MQLMTDAQKRYETERHALFFKDEACKKLYTDHVSFLVNRVNSVNGEEEAAQCTPDAQHHEWHRWG